MPQILSAIPDFLSSPDIDVVDAGLGAFNQQVAPIDSIKPLSCFAHLAEGRTIGGVVGRTWGVCCELQQLWVYEAFRHQGIGTQLLQQFEEQAALRGCRVFYLETFSFQSPEFYESLGYKVALQIAGFPDDICKFVMIKEL